MKTLLLIAGLLALLVPTVLAQEAPEAEVEENPIEEILEVTEAAMVGVGSMDAELLGDVLLQGGLLVADESPMEEATVMSVEQLLEVMGDADGMGRETDWTCDEDDVIVIGDYALATGHVAAEEQDVTVMACLTRMDGMWKVAAMFGFPGELDMGEDAELPEEIDEIIGELSEGEQTGMQAALPYLPEESHAFFLVAGPGFTIPLGGVEAIREQVGEWEDPAEVDTTPVAQALVSPTAVVCAFESTFLNGDVVTHSTNVVAFAMLDGEWRLVSFLSGSVPMVEEENEEENQ
ncbi:MAG: hypothetical protein GF320_20400 [Armatimonadia bacterium]|nr:hypothetical protein [Armatimonadia bacterium]